MALFGNTIGFSVVSRPTRPTAGFESVGPSSLRFQLVVYPYGYLQVLLINSQRYCKSGHI